MDVEAWGGDIYAVGTWKGQKRRGLVGGWRAIWEREWVRGLMDGWRRSGVGDVARSRWREQLEGRRWEEQALVGSGRARMICQGLRGRPRRGKGTGGIWIGSCAGENDERGRVRIGR